MSGYDPRFFSIPRRSGWLDTMMLPHHMQHPTPGYTIIQYDFEGKTDRQFVGHSYHQTNPQSIPRSEPATLLDAEFGGLRAGGKMQTLLRAIVGSGKPFAILDEHMERLMYDRRPVQRLPPRWVSPTLVRIARHACKGPLHDNYVAKFLDTAMGIETTARRGRRTLFNPLFGHPYGQSTR